MSVFRPVGVAGLGSMPITLVGSIALLLVLLRFISFEVVLSATSNSKREVPMMQTLTDDIRIFLSSVFETIWAIGVGGVVGLLSA